MKRLSKLKPFELSRKELKSIGAGKRVCSYSFSYTTYENGQSVTNTEIFGNYQQAAYYHSSNSHNPSSIRRSCSDALPDNLA